jgi:hypothetical protein
MLLFYKLVVLLGIILSCSSFVVNLQKTFMTSHLYSEKKSQSKLPDGFQFAESTDGVFTGTRPNSPKIPIKVKTIKKLKYYISKGYRVPDLDVRGDTIPETPSMQIHPVIKALHDRKIQNSMPGNRTDSRKIAIAVEGGGMRGCVGAGMITAFWYLGLQDSIDVVYGSSAGALVGAYFISGQLPHYGPEVYYDVLTSAGRDFIDLPAVLRSCGLGWLDLRPSSLRSLYSDRYLRSDVKTIFLMNVSSSSQTGQTRAQSGVSVRDHRAEDQAHGLARLLAQTDHRQADAQGETDSLVISAYILNQVSF